MALIKTKSNQIIVILIDGNAGCDTNSSTDWFEACLCLFFFIILLLSLVVDRRDRQERWEGGVMTCDKGCMPDWRVHSMRLSHLSCHDTIKPRGL